MHIHADTRVRADIIRVLTHRALPTSYLLATTREKGKAAGKD